MDLSFLSNIEDKVTLIAPSRRLAASLRQFLNKSKAINQQAWETVSVYALEDWKASLWAQYEIEGLTLKLLLNPLQSLLRFEQIIINSETGKGLLRQHQAAKTALQAWDLIHHWQCEDIIHQNGNNANEEAFYEWARTFEQWLSESGYIDNTLLTQQLLTLITDNEEIVTKISPVKAIHLYGFEELSPLTSYFFESLKTQRWQINHSDIPSVMPQSCRRIAFNQKEAEFYAAAHWAKEASQKNQTIGIVVPNLADERVALDRVFRNVFAPIDAVNPSQMICKDFNISAATPLIQYPIVFEAINLIKFALLECDVIDVCKALSCVFIIGAQREQFDRAKMAGLVGRSTKEKLNIKQVIDHFKNHQDVSAPVLLQNLNKLLGIKNQQQAPSQWALVFKEILSILGWPGDRSLTSNEYQLVKRMDELFNEMMLANSVLQGQDAFGAIQLLQKMAANVPFQAENKGAKIQILGLIEAIGQSFDNCWVMGMDSEAWPPIPTPNPYIPVELQQKLNMPHASAQRELAYASGVTKRFRESAQNIIFSYTLKDKEKSLNVSELILDIPLMSDVLTMSPTRLEDKFTQSDVLESLLDERAPPLNAMDTFKGTATTLQLQAICPFKAFSEQRLMLKQPIDKSLWLIPSEQGNILHDVLEDFWKHFKSLEKVNASTDEEISYFIQITIEKQLSRYVSPTTPSTYIACEKNRLNAIMMDYIDLEKTRMPFKVLTTEQKLTFTLANITFSIRLDRVDENHHNEHVIIDYKTGQYGFTSGVWQDRLETPQLPLYYIASTQYAPKAVVVIKVNSKNCEYEGISESPSDMVGVETLDNLKIQDKPATWDALGAYWLERLTYLADEFKSGNAAVLPLYRDSCHYCHLSALCRVKEVHHD